LKKVILVLQHGYGKYNSTAPLMVAAFSGGSSGLGVSGGIYSKFGQVS
jgi:hypothetical protein